MSDPPEPTLERAAHPPAKLPVRAGSHRWRWLTLSLLAAVVLVLGANVVYRAGPKERTDLPVYLAGARRVAAGEVPFGALSDRGWPYVWPPTLGVLVLPLALLSNQAAAAVFYALSLALLFGGLRSLRASLGTRPGSSWVGEAVPLLLVLLPCTSALQRGQMSPVLLGLLGMAAGALARDRQVRAGLLVALATAIKATPGFVLVGLIMARRWRAVAAGLLGLLFLLVVLPWPFLGFGGTATSIERFADRMVLRYLRDPGSREIEPGWAYDIHIGTNQSLHSQIVRHLNPPERDVALTGATLLLLLPALLLCARGQVRPEPGAYALLLTAPLLIGPIAWHHYYLLALPALMCLWRMRGSRLVRTTLAVFAALCLLHFAVKPLRPYGLLGVATLLAHLVLMVRLWFCGSTACRRRISEWRGTGGEEGHSAHGGR